MAQAESSHGDGPDKIVSTTPASEQPFVPSLATSPLGGVLRPGFTPEDVTRMQPEINAAMDKALEALRRQAGQRPPSPEDPNSH